MDNNLNEKPARSNKKQLPHLRLLDSTIRDSRVLSANAFRIYIILRFRRNRKTGQCNPAVETLEKDANMSKSTVQRALKELEKLGWIARQSGRGKKSNKYSFPASAIMTETISAEKAVPAATFQKTEDGQIFEPFAETAGIPDQDFRLALDRELFWVLKQKNLSRQSFKAQPWLDLLLTLHQEEMLIYFQEFYLSTEKQKWVNNVTPQLLSGQIGLFKTGKQLANKRQTESETNVQYLQRKKNEYPDYPSERFNLSLDKCIGWNADRGKKTSRESFDKWLHEDYEDWLEGKS
jgi:hypothetical protein